MLCSRCNKNIAVVFVTKQEGTQTINEGLCLTCAKELGIKPVEDLMKQMNINEEDIEQMNEGMNELLASENMEELEGSFMNGSNPLILLKISSAETLRLMRIMRNFPVIPAKARRRKPRKTLYPKRKVCWTLMELI